MLNEQQYVFYFECPQCHTVLSSEIDPYSTVFVALIKHGFEILDLRPVGSDGKRNDLQLVMDAQYFGRVLRMLGDEQGFAAACTILAANEIQ